MVWVSHKLQLLACENEENKILHWKNPHFISVNGGCIKSTVNVTEVFRKRREKYWIFSFNSVKKNWTSCIVDAATQAINL